MRLAGAESVLLDNAHTPWTVWGTAKSERFAGGGRMTVHAGGGNDKINTGNHDDYVHGGPGRDRATTWGGEDTCANIEVLASDDSCEFRE